jgi:hypothetical protein
LIAAEVIIAGLAKTRVKLVLPSPVGKTQFKPGKTPAVCLHHGQACQPLKNSCRRQRLLLYGLKLLQLSPSSAAIEPVFSKFGVVQTKLRNQLGLKKLQGL